MNLTINKKESPCWCFLFDFVALLQNEFTMPTFKSIAFKAENIAFRLSDNRIVSIPLQWVPKLEKASAHVRENYILRGHFAFWEEVDEIIGVKNLLNGTIVPQ